LRFKQPDLTTKVAFLRAMRLVYHHNDVRAFIQSAAGLTKLVDGSDEHLAEYLATSIAHHLNIPKPVGRMFAGAYAALGGSESEKQVNRELAAVEYLEQELKTLDSLRSVDE
jgi:hypothetical protein